MTLKVATCVTHELFLYGVCSWDSVVKCEGTLEGTRVLGMWGENASPGAT